MSRWGIASVEESLIQNVLRDMHMKGPHQTSMNILADWYEENNNDRKSKIWRFLSRENRIPVNHGTFIWYQENCVVQLEAKEYCGILPDVIFNGLTGHTNNDGEFHGSKSPWKVYKKRKQAIEAVIDCFTSLEENDRSNVLLWSASKSHQYHQKKHVRDYNERIQSQIDNDPQQCVFPYEARKTFCREDIQTEELILLSYLFRFTNEGKMGCIKSDEFIQELGKGVINDNVGDMIKRLVDKGFLEQSVIVVDGEPTRSLMIHW